MQEGARTRLSGRPVCEWRRESECIWKATATAHVRSCDPPIRFSSSQGRFAATGLGDIYGSIRDRTYKRVGLQTPEEKQVESRIKEMAPSPERALTRLHRKRWGRPQMLVDAMTGKVEAKVTEHKYSTANFRISPRKLQLLADQIGGGKPIDYAILQMQFSHKRAAKRIKSTLALARDHASAKGMDVAKLVVAEAWVGKGRTFKRVEIKGRGRMGIRKSFQAKMSVVLREGKTWEAKQAKKMEDEKKRVRRIGTGGVVRTNRPVINTFQRPGWQW